MRLRFTSMVVAVALGAMLGACGGGHGKPTPGHRIALAGATSLEIDADNGAVLLAGVAAPATDVTVATAVEGNAPATLPVTWTRLGGRTIVTIGNSAGTSQLPFVAASHLAYRLTYPAALPLLVRAFGGDVRVENPTGEVEITDAQGNVTVVNPKANVKVGDSGGAISVTNAGAGIDLATQAGTVSAALTRAWRPNPIRMESSNGDVRLTVFPAFRARVDASSASGAVRDALAPSARRAHGPPAWLYTARGDVTIAIATP